jgi:hypothetical protein
MDRKDHRPGFGKADQRLPLSPHKRPAAPVDPWIRLAPGLVQAGVAVHQGIHPPQRLFGADRIKQSLHPAGNLGLVIGDRAVNADQRPTQLFRQ